MSSAKILPFCSGLNGFNSSPPSAAYMRQLTGSALIRVMAWRRTGANAALFSKWPLGTKIHWNYNGHTNPFNHENAFENVVCRSGSHFVQGGGGWGVGVGVIKRMLGVYLTYSIANSCWRQIKQRATSECNNRHFLVTLPAVWCRNGLDSLSIISLLQK